MFNAIQFQEIEFKERYNVKSEKVCLQIPIKDKMKYAAKTEESGTSRKAAITRNESSQS